MWKPLRLQGVGASSSIINANTQPAGKLTPWRLRVTCLFGLGPDGSPNTFNPSCGSGWTDFKPTTFNPQVDRIAFEGIVGWDAAANGNLAQLLQEPSLMGALEGAGITVVAKGVYFPSSSFDPTLTFGFPTGTVLFTSGNTAKYCSGTYPSNFQCNPSSIDGLGITDSSQGGGGIFVHAWGHNLQIANNRIYNNAGTLSGGINLGLGEFPPNTIVGGGTTNLPPGSCESAGATGSILPYCLDTHVNMHHNYISLNNSTGDELFSATPAGAGGVSICTGSDYYKFNYNWVCGNLSNGDGGGLGHLGFSKNGDIEHNSILFNQSTNPTIPTNGGGIVVMGTPDADPTCGATTDQDCVSPLGALAPSDGIGPGLVINANLIMGNAAESGSGGGIAFQNVNGSDVIAFPNNPSQWFNVMLTNNIIANNVAGWDGGGVSLLDALMVQIVNNTIISNVTTATAGPLTNTLGAPLASTQNCPPGGTNAQGLCTVQITSSTPQPAGVVSINNSAILMSNFPATITCPAGFSAPGSSTINGSCRSVSYPHLHNNVIYGNESTYVAVGSLSPQFQQNVVTLYNAFTNSPVGTVPTTAGTTANGAGVIVTGGTGACLVSGSNAGQYWDIGVRGDTGPTAHSSGVTLNPRWSVLSPNATGYFSNNLLVNPEVQSQYCTGSRQPPEACAANSGGGNGGCGWAVPPGVSDATVPNPIFNLTPVATVDEGNNWINMRFGPLSLTNPTVKGADGNYGGGPLLGNYALAASSAALDYVPVVDNDNDQVFPTTDFFGNPRPDPSNPKAFDVGAVEYQGNGAAVKPALTSIAPTSGQRGASVNVTLTGTGLTQVTAVQASGNGITVSNVVVVNDGTVTATFTITATAGLTARTITVSTAGFTSNTETFTVTGATLASISPTSGVRGTTVPVTLTGTGLTGATAVTASGSGVACLITGTPTDTTVTANCTIAAAAGATARTVSVTTPIGTTNTVTFTVTALTPTLTSISPTSGVRGAAVPVTLTGTNLTGATWSAATTAAYPNITFGALTVGAGGTTATATLTIASATTPGVKNLSVTTAAGGTSNTVAFTVTGATVAFAGPTPALTTALGNTTTKIGTITVSNTATGANAGPLTLIAAPTIAKVGTAGGTFSITGGTCASGAVISAGGSCTISVQYVPSGTATATANVTIADTGAATATQTGGNFNGN
jgi:hypothetical protein